MKHQLLVGLSSAIVIAGVAGCGTSGIPSPASSVSAPSPAAVAPSPCTTLGGTSDPDQTCHVHSETSTYTLDFRFPVNYPDMRPVTDYIAHRSDDFVDWLKQYPVPGGTHSELDILGRSYESSSTQSLVLDVHTEGGVHPVTTFKAFNYDVGKRAPITLDTLFKPGAQPQEVLNPIVQRELDKRQASDVSSDDFGLGRVC